MKNRLRNHAICLRRKPIRAVHPPAPQNSCEKPFTMLATLARRDMCLLAASYPLRAAG